MSLLWLGSFIILGLTLFYQRASLSVWTIALTLYLLLLSRLSALSSLGLALNWILMLGVGMLLAKPIRKRLISKRILPIYSKLMPTLSRTEKEALAAGTVGWEGELFSGNPNWQKLAQYPANQLSAEEQAFIDGPVTQACRMIDDWDITHRRADLSPELWRFLKEQGFFALIIPKQYGGKAFSAYAHSVILQKLYSRSATVASTVAVPNSLGPAELLLHYGTEQQKAYYLPRLASGEEIPCFALTSPEAGSDAGAIPDIGIICQGQFQGKTCLGIRLNWDKRYITLAPVATVLGLAFKLYDPELLLGSTPELGITCALIPVTTPGITIGRRHYPLNIVFQNGPTQGKDVFIPLDWIIGGPAMAGQGWKMLVECLSAGRAISLPANVIGGAKAAALASGAYARIRKQFNQPIGYFEGIEEALARLAGFTYLLDAGNCLAMSAIDAGEKPAVISAIMKYHATERCRQLIIDAMDIHGGKGICLGPRNYLARMYQGAPISITVEGANILTRNMIIFGQGAIRCHPFLLAELEAAQEGNAQLRLTRFDTALFGHINFTLSNMVRSLLLGITHGRLALFPASPAKKYLQQFTRFSASFALIADITMLLLGGKLKRKERISARLGDVLSMLYLGSAVVKQYAGRGYPSEEKALVDWSCQTLLFMLQQQLDLLLKNFPNRIGALLLQALIFPLGKRLAPPKDKLDQQLAKLLLTPSALRSQLTREVDTTPIVNNPLGILEKVLELTLAAEPLYMILQTAKRDGLISGNTLEELVTAAQEKNILTEAEIKQLQRLEAGRKEIIAVDDFDSAEFSKQ